MNIIDFCMDNFQSPKDASIEALKAWESLPKDWEGNSLDEVDFWKEGDGESLDSRQRLHYVAFDGRLKTIFYYYYKKDNDECMGYACPFTPIKD